MEALGILSGRVLRATYAPGDGDKQTRICPVCGEMANTVNTTADALALTCRHKHITALPAASGEDSGSAGQTNMSMK